MTKLFILEEQCHFDLKQLWVQLQRCIASADSYSDCQWNSNAYFTEYITAVRIMSSFSPGAYFILFIQLLGQVKKKTRFSSPPTSFFSATSLFLLSFMSNFFMSKTNRRHFYFVLSSPLSHTKKTQNSERAFVCILIRTQTKILKTWYARSNVSLGEGNNA